MAGINKLEINDIIEHYIANQLQIKLQDDASKNYGVDSLKSNDPSAYYQLGYVYQYGLGSTKKDAMKAFYNYKIAAEGNHPGAQYTAYQLYGTREGGRTSDCVRIVDEEELIQLKLHMYLKSASQDPWFTRAHDELWSHYKRSSHWKRALEETRINYLKKLQSIDQLSNQEAGQIYNELGYITLQLTKYSNNQDYSKALNYFERGAQLGNSSAYFNLGAKMYRNGLGVTKDRHKEEEYERKAAQLGHPRAQFYLGCLLFGYLSVGHEEDLIKAYKYFKQSSKYNYTVVGYYLGLYNLLGIAGVKSNVQNAIKLFQTAAVAHDYTSDKSNELALQILGFMYEKGIGVGIDYSLAAHYYASAAKMNYFPAYIKLAKLVEKKKVSPSSFDSAIKLYDYAARSDDESYSGHAKYRLGKVYTKAASTLLRNSEKGFRFFETAIQSYRNALEKQWFKQVRIHYHLGVMYMNGYGVKINPEQAIEHLKKAMRKAQKTYILYDNHYGRKAKQKLEKLVRSMPNKEHILDSIKDVQFVTNHGRRVSSSSSRESLVSKDNSLKRKSNQNLASRESRLSVNQDTDLSLLSPNEHKGDKASIRGEKSSSTLDAPSSNKASSKDKRRNSSVDYANLEEFRNKTELKIQEFKSKISQLEAERSKLAKEKDKLAESVQYYQSKVNDKENELRYLQDRNDALAKKAHDAQVKTIELEKEIEHFKTEFESVKVEKEALAINLRTTEQKLANKDEQLVTLLAKLEKLKGENKALNNGKLALEKKGIEYNTQIKELGRKIVTYEETINSLDVELKELQNEKKSMMQLLKEMEAKDAAKGESVTAILSQIQLLSGDKQSLEHEKFKLREEISSKSSEIDQLKNRITELERVKREGERAMNKLMAEKDKLNKNLEAIETKLKDKDTELNDMMQRIVQLENEKKAVIVEKTNLSESLAKESLMNQTLQEEYDLMKEELKNLKENVIQLETQKRIAEDLVHKLESEAESKESNTTESTEKEESRAAGAPSMKIILEAEESTSSSENQQVKVRRLRLSGMDNATGLPSEMLTVTGLLQRRNSFDFPNDQEVGLAAMEMGEPNIDSTKGIYTEVGVQCELGKSTLLRLLQGPETSDAIADDKTPLLANSKQSSSVASKLPCCAIM
ncbi:Myosin-11 [Trichoplax sp. H2]|nr:Myosin-11 [Trichoplax sp. H2]|eukprot:RDD42610.1 Myosin-11 [Trichoplax sp. H2]